MTLYTTGINHFQLNEICIPLVNQGTNSIKGTVSVFTWGHLSHWLHTASCSDIWPQNSAWQRPSNSLRSVRQTHTYSWKQPTHRHTHAPLNSQDHTFLWTFCVGRCLQMYTNITAWASFLLLSMRHCLRLLHHYSSFRHKITVHNSILLNYCTFYKWDGAFCQYTWKPGSSLLKFAAKQLHLSNSYKHTSAYQSE